MNATQTIEETKLKLQAEQFNGETKIKETELELRQRELDAKIEDSRPHAYIVKETEITISTG